MAKKEKSFEESLERLQEISEQLESEELALEDAINLYEEGIKLSKICYSQLENAELKIKQLKEGLESEFKEDLDLEG